MPTARAGDLPDFSPDGSKIVFAAQPAGATARDIYVVPSDGGTPHQLTTVGNYVYPAFSPDGSKIVFTSNRTGTSQVYVMNADGSGQTQLTSDPQPKDQVPDWSPDGSKIAYLADAPKRLESRVLRGRGRWPKRGYLLRDRRHGCARGADADIE